VAAARQPEGLGRLASLARALVRHRSAALLYADAGPRVAGRRVDVLALCWRDRWLAAVRCRRGGALRLLPVDRIVRCRVLGDAAAPGAPPGFDPGFFSSVGFLAPGAAPLATATVELSAPLDRLSPAFFPSARHERTGGRVVLCHQPVSDLAALEGLVASLGPAARLLGGPRAGAGASSLAGPPGPPDAVHFPSGMATGAKTGSAERRLLRLAAWLVASGRPVTREEIYQAFPRDYTGKAEAREKKWTRDKRDLKRLGIPVVFVEEEDDRGAYLVDPTSCLLPKLDFSPEEASVLWMAGQAALRTHDHPLRDDLDTALRKLVVGAKGLPPRAATLEADRAVLEPEQLRGWLETLAESVERRKQVKVLYRKPDGEETERRVDVYGYAWRRGQWIFVGYCHLREAVRLFLVERVRSLAPAPVERKKPDYEIPPSFDIRDWSRQAPWDYLVHEGREASVRFRGSLARVADQLLPGAELATGPDNARVARLSVRNLRGLVRQALAWGPEAEVLSPPEARDMARQMLGNLRVRLGAGEAR